MNTKKILALLAVAVLGASFVGCSKPADETTTTDTKTATPATTATTGGATSDTTKTTTTP